MHAWCWICGFKVGEFQVRGEDYGIPPTQGRYSKYFTDFEAQDRAIRIDTDLRAGGGLRRLCQEMPLWWLGHGRLGEDHGGAQGQLRNRGTQREFNILPALLLYRGLLAVHP